MAFIDKINYLNDRLKQGDTVIRIREDLKIGEKSLQKEIRKNGYKYSSKDRQYISITEITTSSTTNTIIINLVDDKHLTPKPKSIRINEFICQDWKGFCESKHYSKQDLISIALKEYMEKYK